MAKESDISSKWVLSVEQSISDNENFKIHVNFNKTRRKSMKLTVKPQNILEAVALQTRKELSPFLLAMLGMGVSQSVVTAVRLGVFDALKDHPKLLLN